MKGELAHVVGRRNREILRPRMKVVCCATQSRTVLSEIKPRLIQVSGKDCNWVDLPCVDSEEGIYEIPFQFVFCFVLFCFVVDFVLIVFFFIVCGIRLVLSICLHLNEKKSLLNLQTLSLR